jgi:hypothetical protein
MNQLAFRLVSALENNEIINYYIEYRYLKIIDPQRRPGTYETSEQINDIDIETMRSAVRQAGINVASKIQTVWS